MQTLEIPSIGLEQEGLSPGLLAYLARVIRRITSINSEDFVILQNVFSYSMIFAILDWEGRGRGREEIYIYNILGVFQQ